MNTETINIGFNRDHETESPEYNRLIENIHYPFIDRSLIKAFENLARNLKQDLHKYDTLIGDDISGRLPTLVIASLLRQKRKQMNLTPPKVFFINAGSNLSYRRSHDETAGKLSVLIKNNKHRSEKALIVTEYIDTGDSVLALLEELKIHDIEPDVCTVSTRSQLERYAKEIPGKLIVGAETSAIGVDFFNSVSLSGLRSTDSSPVAERLTDPKRISEANLARVDMQLLADYLWGIIE